MKYHNLKNLYTLKIHTRTLTTGQSLTLSAIDGAMMVSIQVAAVGSATYEGGISFAGQASTALSISNGQVVTVGALSPASPLDGITITSVSGDVDILVGL